MLLLGLPENSRRRVTAELPLEKQNDCGSTGCPEMGLGHGPYSRRLSSRASTNSCFRTIRLVDTFGQKRKRR